MTKENELKYCIFIGAIFSTIFTYLLIIFPFSFIVLVWNHHQWVTNLILTEMILMASSFFCSCLFQKIKEILEKEIQNAN